MNRNVELNGDTVTNIELNKESVDPNNIFFNQLRKFGFGVGTESVQIILNLDEKGSLQLKDLTTKHTGEQLAVVLDGKLLTHAKIIAPITGGQIAIGAYQSAEEAEEIVKKIEASLK